MAKKANVEETKNEVVEAKTEVTETVSEAKSNETSSSKKNSKTALIVVISCVAALLVAAGCFFGYKFFMGKDPVKVTSKAIRGLKDKFEEVKDDNEEITKIMEGDEPYEISTKVEMNLPKELGIKNIDFSVLAQIDSENQKGIGTVKALIGKELIADMSAALDENKVYFKLNDTMDKYYSFNIEEALKSIDSSEFDKLAKIDYDGTKLIDYLADAVDKAFSKSDFDKDKTELTIDDKDVKVNVYTAKVTGKKLDTIVDSFLNSVLKDKDLIKVVAELSGEDESDIKSAIKEVIKEDLSKDFDAEFEYNVYVTSMGDAIGYGFGVEGAEFIIANYKDVTSIQVTAEGVTGSLEFKKESKNHSVVNLNVMGMITGTIDIKSDLETISKNKEYKETVNIDGSLTAMGQTYKASIKAVSTIKKISKVDLSATKDALDVENLTSLEQMEFENAVEKSSIYKFFSSYKYGMKTTNKTPIIDYEPVNYNLSSY